MIPATLKRVMNWTDGKVPDQIVNGMKGFMLLPPTVGASFVLVHPTDGDYGAFATSVIETVNSHGNGKYTFRTQNSVYQLELDE